MIYIPYNILLLVLILVCSVSIYVVRCDSCITSTQTLHSLASCIAAHTPRKSTLDGLITGSDTLDKSLSDALLSQWDMVVTEMLVHGDCAPIGKRSDLTLLARHYDRYTVAHDARFCALMKRDLSIPELDDDTFDGLFWWHGTLIVRLSQQEQQRCSTDIHVHVPHPITDGTVLEQGAFVLEETQCARTLLVAGTTRNAVSNVENECQKGYGLLDAAHQDRLMFHHTVVQLSKLYSSNSAFHDRDFVTVQLHGMAETTCADTDVYLSDGTSLTSPTDRSKPEYTHFFGLYDAIRSVKPTWNTSHVGSDEYGDCKLKATTNVQGRYLNLGDMTHSPDTCAVQPRKVSGRFIHIEQVRKVRDIDEEGRIWAQIFNTAFSPLLPPLPSIGTHPSHNLLYIVVITMLTATTVLVFQF